MHMLHMCYAEQILPLLSPTAAAAASLHGIVTANTTFNASRGFGWSTSSAAHDAFVLRMSAEGPHLVVVSVCTPGYGFAGSHVGRGIVEQMYEDGSGAPLTAAVRDGVDGSTAVLAFNASVGRDKTLVLRFKCEACGSPAFDRADSAESWAFSALGIAPWSQLLVPALPQQVQVAISNAAWIRSGIRDWAIIGPFDDTLATALDGDMQAVQPVRLSVHYTGKIANDFVRWQHADLRNTTRWPVPLLQLHDFNITDADGMGAAAAALTHIHNPLMLPMTVRLVGSSSSASTVSLNGHRIWHDRLATGTLLREDHAEASLQPGWNQLIVPTPSNQPLHLPTRLTLIR